MLMTPPRKWTRWGWLMDPVYLKGLLLIVVLVGFTVWLCL
jgi:hypothetical protein